MIKTTKNVKEANCITHGGVFHADEVFATIILEDVLDTDITVARVLNVPENVEDAIIYDIGGGDLDHHQRGGNGERKNGVPYASCGLVWNNFASNKYSEDEIDYIDKLLIQTIDANDNGTIPKIDYCVNVVNICNIISWMNATWDNNIDNDERFIKACNIAREIYKAAIKKALSTLKATQYVNSAIDESSDGIVILDTFMPWQSALFKHEKCNEINFIIFPSKRGGYSCQCIPTEIGGFDQRIPLPESWRGLSGEELEKVSGIEGAIFCHKAGFLCSNKTMAGAILMAMNASGLY